MNKCTIIGNLTKAPELRHTQDGTPVCGFSVAVNRPKSRADRENNRDPGADYFNVNVWRALGENCAKYLDKGRKVCVIGRVSLRTWDKDGKHGASLEVEAEDVEFLSTRSEAPAAEPSPAVDAASGFQTVETDELPF